MESVLKNLIDIFRVFTDIDQFFFTFGVLF